MLSHNSLKKKKNQSYTLASIKQDLVELRLMPGVGEKYGMKERLSIRFLSVF